MAWHQFHRGVPGALRYEIIERSAAGGTHVAVAAAVGVSERTVYRVLREGVPVQPAWNDRATDHLSAAQREEISLGLAGGDSLRAIARSLGCAPSTISREVSRNGGRADYRAWRAEAAAYASARRGKPRKLEANQRLIGQVNLWMALRWSPQQIAARLKLDFPDDAEMRVSHETIYQTFFLQGKGLLRTELAVALRAGHTSRRPRRHGAESTVGKIKGMVIISDRPAEIEDRAIPGHWEGDLIVGKNSKSAIATLVERSTRFVMLAKITSKHTDVVCEAVTAKILTLPVELRRSLTWDQGGEMADHAQFSVATDITIYFCDPHSPWQRGTNENTNGLLRQYFPKSTDLSVHTQQHLDNVAAELNDRPRQTLNWMKPSEKFTELVLR